MTFLDKYNIQFGILIRGENLFKFNIDEEFFDHFDFNDINSSNLNVILNIEKSSNLLIFRFSINGFVNVPCDRCLDDFDFNIDTENELFVKFTESEYEEQSDNLILIPKHENEINVAQFIYEFISLSLPIQKVHPLDEKGQSTCNKEMLERINNFKTENNNVSVWNELNKLKNGTS